MSLHLYNTQDVVVYGVEDLVAFMSTSPPHAQYTLHLTWCNLTLIHLDVVFNYSPPQLFHPLCH